MTVTHPETRWDDGVVYFGDAYRERPNGSNVTQNGDGADLGSRLLLLLQWLSTRTLYDGLHPTALSTLWNESRVPMVIEGDIRACFDKIPHEHLLRAVARRIADTGMLALIRRFLKSGIMIERTLVQSSE